MSTTPLWVPLVVAALGLLGAVVGTIGGVVITQRRSDRREALAWDRQQEHEARAWAREDAARTFEHRRQAYSDFHESLRAMMLLVYNHGMGLTPDEADELPWDWQFPTYQRLLHLELYSTAVVGLAAREAYNAAYDWGHMTRRGVDDLDFYERQERADEAEAALWRAMRKSLAIPDQ